MESKNGGGACGSIISIPKGVESDFFEILAKEETEEEDAASKENKITRTTKEQDVKYKSFMRQPAMPEKHTKSGGACGSITSIPEVVESDFFEILAKEETEEEDAVSPDVWWWCRWGETEEEDAASKDNKITRTTKEQDMKDKTVSETSSDRETVNTEAEFEEVRQMLAWMEGAEDEQDVKYKTDESTETSADRETVNDEPVRLAPPTEAEIAEARRIIDAAGCGVWIAPGTGADVNVAKRIVAKGCGRGGAPRLVPNWDNESGDTLIALCQVCDWFEVQMVGKYCLDCGEYMVYKMERKTLVAFAKNRHLKETPSKD